MDLSSYAALPEPPQKPTATTILIRVVDATAARYYWATEGLRQSEMDYRPGPESMTILGLLRHVHGLAARCKRAMAGEAQPQAPAPQPPAPIEDLETLRRETLENLSALRERLGAMTDEDLNSVIVNKMPFWFLINGPLIDMASHIGQVNGWRRLAGNPTLKSTHFKGDAPKKA